jgi:superfamily I DNA/RNA helicase/mRNA-degrading endonuclease RelE of RelBE toxin-antitoxin system
MSKYHLITPPAFLSELLELPDKVRKALTQKVKILERDPISAQGDAKKLKNSNPPLYRVRIGEYRLIYTFDSGWVQLIAIRKRDDQTYQRDFGQIDLPDHAPPSLVDPDTIDALLTTPMQSAALPPLAGDSSSRQPQLLPRRLTAEDLRHWHIAEQYWSILLAVQTEEDLLSAPVPQQIIERVLDILYPRNIDDILHQPRFLLNEAEDLDRFVAGELTDFLLMLDPDQQRLATTSIDHPVLVRGGPGTGKSIIALYRVKHLVEQGITPILFTTFTNTLTAYSTQLLERLLGSDPATKGVEVATVDSLIVRHYTRAYGPPNFATDNEQREALEQALLNTPMPGVNERDRQRRREVLQLLGIDYLRDEFIHVIEHWGLTDQVAYLTQSRTGRRLPLRPPIREAVWAVYETWRAILAQTGKTTWGYVRQQALALAQQQATHPYRAIVIDEAQDLSPVALRYLLACVESPTAIYLTADAAQSLYQRGFAWQQIDTMLQVRGRSYVLRRNYRNTAQIATACAAILGQSNDQPAIDAVHEGPRPVVRFCRSVSEEAIAIRDFLMTAARQWRLPIHAGAVLCHSRQVAQQICDELQQIGVSAELTEKKQIDLRKPVVKVMTIHSAKGLEFPFVAVLRLAQDHLPHSFEHLPPEERDEMIEQERRLFYVGCSRAMRALLVCADADQPSPFVLDLPNELWQWEEK